MTDQSMRPPSEGTRTTPDMPRGHLSTLVTGAGNSSTALGFTRTELPRTRARVERARARQRARFEAGATRACSVFARSRHRRSDRAAPSWGAVDASHDTTYAPRTQARAASRGDTRR